MFFNLKLTYRSVLKKEKFLLLHKFPFHYRQSAYVYERSSKPFKYFNLPQQLERVVEDDEKTHQKWLLECGKERNEWWLRQMGKIYKLKLPTDPFLEQRLGVWNCVLKGIFLTALYQNFISVVFKRFT